MVESNMWSKPCLKSMPKDLIIPILLVLLTTDVISLYVKEYMVENAANKRGKSNMVINIISSDSIHSS